MKSALAIICFLILIINAGAQNSFKCVVKDAASKDVLPGVNVVLKGTLKAANTDANGKAIITDIPAGEHKIHFSFVGYREMNKEFDFPLADTNYVIVFLSTEEESLEEVVVSTTRTNSRIEDLSTKVEVLGGEEMDEESTVVPGSVTSILGDLSIITIQRTNPVNGNDAIRMQGLDTRYTQIMRDGLPLYGGFSGSLGVLAIPPLDLKQVEIIKGSASTLYGGGAIGGLINFISKEPTDTPQTTLTFNATSLKEYNLNAFTSKKKGKMGLTLFGGANIKTPQDINKDGFAEVPEHRNVTLHPRMFYDFNKRNKLIVGLTTAYDTRLAGDMRAIQFRTDTLHTFLQKEKTFRNTLDAKFTSQLNEKNTLTLKTAGSAFQRDVDYSGFIFNGVQYSTYSELNDFIKLKKHEIVLGTNLMSETFVKNNSDSVLFNGYNYYTIGTFTQDDWHIGEKFSIQTGMRFDTHNKYGKFFLPRLSFMYKPNRNMSIRLGGGSGYKVPNLFDFTNPANNLLDIQSTVRPERSWGINSDINYHTVIFDEVIVQLNQAFYYSYIANPVMISTNVMGQKVLMNGNYFVNSYGTDTYIRIAIDELGIYLGYNHTESLQMTSNTYAYMPFNPRDKFSTTIAYEEEGEWRCGIEASWVGNQYIYNNERVHNFWFMAAMFEKKFKFGSVVLNCENLFDVRQSKFEQLVTGTTANPQFRSIWAPLEGRVINLSVRLSI